MRTLNFLYCLVKDGVCSKAVAFGPCVVTCGADEDCDGSKKCCSNGCGSWCVEPSKEQMSFFSINECHILLRYISFV